MLFGKRKRIVNKILIVEDEPLTAFDNELMLREAGYEVVATVDRFRDAVAALDKVQVDLVLSDVRLTGERTGIDLALEGRRRSIPVLFVTGAAPENACDLVVGVLMKPYNHRTMRSALNAVDCYLSGKKVRPPRGLTLFPKAEV